MTEPIDFPRGRPAHEVLHQLDELRQGDADWRSGRTFSLVYHPDRDELESLLEEVGQRFLHENALNPFAFPSLMRMEQDVVSWAAGLLHGPPKAGKLSSGGTESIFLAVQTARDWARRARSISEPTIVTPSTAHPAFAKACHYLDIEQVRVPVGPDLRADVAATSDAVDDRTALVVGSAPNYPYGTIDPIEDLAAIAAGRGALCHVDGCLGGWLLPFLERLGQAVPPWDFRVEGVTSVSLDVHKYGYAFKGASVILYRDKPVLEQQYFLYDDWPGGLYGSATTAGTRSAAPIAGAWAAISFLGEPGYTELAEQVRDAMARFMDGIDGIDGLAVTGEPDACAFEFGVTADGPDIGAVGDVMDERGWHLDRQQGGLHLIVFPFHVHVVDDFLADLRHAVEHAGESSGTTRSTGVPKPGTGVYGAVDTEG